MKLILIVLSFFVCNKAFPQTISVMERDSAVKHKVEYKLKQDGFTVTDQDQKHDYNFELYIAGENSSRHIDQTTYAWVILRDASTKETLYRSLEHKISSKEDHPYLVAFRAIMIRDYQAMVDIARNRKSIKVKK